MEKSDFVYKALAGLNEYKREKKRIEFLTISIVKDSEINIMKYFEKLLDTMTLKGGFEIRKDYIGCVVNKQHIHVLIKKPYVQTQVLINNWIRLTGNESNLRCRTVNFEEMSMHKIVNYIARQAIEHELDESQVKFFDNPFWGILPPKKKPKTTKTSTVWGITETPIPEKPKEEKIKKSYIPLSKMIYDSTTGQMREETEEDRIKMQESFEKFKQKLKEEYSQKQENENKKQ